MNGMTMKKGKYVDVRGGRVLVDAEDEDLLSQWNWRILPHGYVCREEYDPESKKVVTIYLHREIMGLPPGTGYELVVDHINDDTTDCRSENLRIVRNADNSRRGRKWNARCTSKHKRVSRRGRSWRAYLNAKGKQVAIGSYPTESEAARASDLWQLFLFGEANTRLNFSRDSYPKTIEPDDLDEFGRITGYLRDLGVIE